MALTVEHLRGGGTDLLTGVNSHLPCRAVRVACVHCDYLHMPAAAAQMLAGHCYWRGDDTIAGKHGGGAYRSICDCHGKVSFATRFDPSLYSSEAEAKWQRFRGDEG